MLYILWAQLFGCMSYRLNSLKWGYIGECLGIIKWDTRSLDYSSYTYGEASTYMLRAPLVPFVIQAPPAHVRIGSALIHAVSGAGGLGQNWSGVSLTQLPPNNPRFML